MKVFLKVIVLLLFIPGFVKAYTVKKDSATISFKEKNILKTMETVADWQITYWNEGKSKWPMWDWIPATAYTGILALADVSHHDKYRQAIVNISDQLNWQTGPRRFYADDYCIGQSYAILYSTYHDKKMIANWQKLADSILAAPHTATLEWKGGIRLREWAWCDALFMGPTSLSYLSTATGDQKYINIASQLWWKTTSYLYDTSEHLYSRDGSYFDKKEKNGKKVFWSRGNGWVMGGMVRLMQNMPENNPEKAKFKDLYKEMAAKVISLQQADGSWHASLLDPQSFDVKETSGTGFYCYALLWGMNNGLLDKKATWPVVKKAWEALATSVQPDGMLGFVQPVGASPDKVDKNSTEAYGVGAFLLSGSELYKFINQNKKLIK